ncbi:uncharacterized protein EI90DRAFT_3054159 [Cantharellus anzutake]|uniref:uncharacterized protein n=1 Tax=Cantharellus anzutake TaxID=1750568 RepID=UPI001904D394|nr:uncharacterized protein EI90DRAFT_3054159 [Cantharellus anzutake]KAF8332725.1 hypothetical protein EI90DRAFT_3054159 [Cantharellus anzutake]
MSDHFDNVTKPLEEFLDCGLYMIRFYERRLAFQNLSTFAIFFAGVPAFSIQFSCDGRHESTFQAVEFLWIFSLFFSIASAIDSQVSYQLSSAVDIKSGAVPPMWVSAWIVTAPFISLLISVGSFVVGIALFTFLKFVNARYAPVCVTIALAIWITGLTCTYMWFFINLNLGSIAKKWVGNIFHIDNNPARPNPPAANQPLPPTWSIRRNTFAPTQWDRITPLIWKPTNDRLRRLAMRVIEDNRLYGPGHNSAQIRQEDNWRIDSNRIAFPSGVYSEEWTGVHVSAVHDIQFSADGKYMATCSQDERIVIWIVDSSNGANVLHSSRPNLASQPLRLAWHPNMIPLLAAMPARGTTLVTFDLRDASLLTISSLSAMQGPVRAIAWMPYNEDLVYTESYYIRCINRKSVEQWSVELPYSLGEVAITPDGTRAIVVGTVDEVGTGDTVKIKPSRSPPERRIILINIEGRQIIFETPTLNQVRSLDVSSAGALLLVTYEGKAFPQLFRIHSAKLVLLQTYCLPEEVEYSGSGQLGFPDWTFGVDGPRRDDCVVMCANKKGTMFIWDRESSHLLKTLEIPLGPASSLTGFAWDHGSFGNPMIAASSADGTIWLYNPQRLDPGVAGQQSTIASTHP